MGYDDGECVECRCENNGGNVHADTRNYICGECLQNISKTTRAMDMRLIRVLKDNMHNGDSTCDRCNQTCTLGFSVSVCEEHDKKVRSDENKCGHLDNKSKWAYSSDEESSEEDDDLWHKKNMCLDFFQQI
jgi:hypothetical protein